MRDLACHLNVALAGLDDARLPEVLERLRAAGYRRVVLAGLTARAAEVSRIRRLLDAVGLLPIAMCNQRDGADVSSDDADVRAAGLARLRDQVRLAADIGADHLTGLAYGRFGTAGGPVPEETRVRTARLVGQAADFGAEHGVVLSCEVLNRYETAFLTTAEQAMRFVLASESPHLGIHLDTFHMMIEEIDVLAAIRLALPRLRYLELGQSGRGGLAFGAMPIAQIVDRVEALGYKGRWGVEAFSRTVLRPETANALAIWRDPYDDGLQLAEEAASLVLDART